MLASSDESARQHVDLIFFTTKLAHVEAIELQGAC